VKTKLQLRETKIAFQEVLQAAQHKAFHKFFKAWEKGNRFVAQHYHWIFVWLQDWAGNALLPCFWDNPCAPADIKQGEHLIFDSGWKLLKEDVHHSIMTQGSIFEVLKSQVELFQNGLELKLLSCDRQVTTANKFSGLGCGLERGAQWAGWLLKSNPS
jgi:hypothetical protein